MKTPPCFSSVFASRIATSLTVFGVVSVLSATACGSKLDGGSDQSVFVRQALAVPTDEASGVRCEYRPETSWPSLHQGLYDIAVSDTYALTLLVQSGSSSGARLEKAHVRVLDSDASVVTEYDSVVQSYVDGGGLSLVDVPAINAVATQRMNEILTPRNARKSFSIEVTLSGKTTPNDLPVTTPSFVLPVTACRGCLVSFESGQDPAVAGPNCNLPLPTTTKRPCHLGQEEVVPCQLCLGRPACRIPNDL